MRIYIELFIQNKGILNKWFPHVQSNSLIVNIQHRISLKQTAQLFDAVPLIFGLHCTCVFSYLSKPLKCIHVTSAFSQGKNCADRYKITEKLCLGGVPKF